MPSAPTLRIDVDPSQVDAAAWDALLATQPHATPFLRHAYLAALHASGSATPESGWNPFFFTLWEGDALAAACALYAKTHSYGEYVFDFAWADAYARHGLDYYPKAVVAVPFTPVPGARLLARDAASRLALLRALIAWCGETQLSSLHLLFGADEDVRAAEAAGLMLRQAVQFHWANEAPTPTRAGDALVEGAVATPPVAGTGRSEAAPHALQPAAPQDHWANEAPTPTRAGDALVEGAVATPPVAGTGRSEAAPHALQPAAPQDACAPSGRILHSAPPSSTPALPQDAPATRRYASFDDFLASLAHNKRKKIRQERRKVHDAGVTFRWARGADIAASDWDFFYRCYARTYAEHGNPPYLTRDFFARMAADLPEAWVLFIAEREGRPIASSLIAISADAANAGGPIHSESTAYGRYWGALERVDCLHFEACYYQPIAWCIAHSVARFEGGAQGEHKMARALMPVQATSAHWLAHPAFADAVERFLEREGDGVAHYLEHLQERSPFRQHPGADS